MLHAKIKNKNAINKSDISEFINISGLMCTKCVSFNNPNEYSQ